MLPGGGSGPIGDGGAGWRVTVLWWIRDTAVVVSAAISLTKRDDPVLVENTTKYGVELQRENEWQRGSRWALSVPYSNLIHIYTHHTVERNRTFGNQSHF